MYWITTVSGCEAEINFSETSITTNVNLSMGEKNLTNLFSKKIELTSHYRKRLSKNS